MDISITEFKHRCLEIVRRVEESGEAVSITRHGRVVAQLEPSPEASSGVNEPWRRLRALGGKLGISRRFVERRSRYPHLDLVAYGRQGAVRG
ncbi:MAG: type II toxin-antitoxin system Phd/YefM family antitoxin [Betaproteobacteria bacterium]|nr:type II toxin-antitoxin system Phd/YefM family antitoxin [Betaproteobacteria bacterium]